MNDRKLSRYRAAEPRVTLRRIEQIHTLEIMLTDLDNLETLFAEEMQALAFATAALGAFLGAVLGWASAGTLRPWAQSTYTAVTAVTAICTLWFGIAWARNRRKRKSLRDRLVGQGQVEYVAETAAEP